MCRYSIPRGAKSTQDRRAGVIPARLVARSVEDCSLVDAVLTKSPDGGPKGARNLQHVKFASAPAQYLLDVDEETPELFREALRKLEDAGAELVEIDLGVDFHDLTARTTWPIFFHETLTAVREFLAATKCPRPIAAWSKWRSCASGADSV